MSRIVKDSRGLFPDVVVYKNKCLECGKEFESVEKMRYCINCEWELYNKKKGK